MHKNNFQHLLVETRYINLYKIDINVNIAYYCYSCYLALYLKFWIFVYVYRNFVMKLLSVLKKNIMIFCHLNSQNFITKQAWLVKRHEPRQLGIPQKEIDAMFPMI